jgi:N-acetylglutamate synthase
MNLAEIESATRIIWPALEQMELPYGVLRYARGVSRRSNSLSIYPECDANGVELISRAEKFFKARQLDSIIRVLDKEAKASCDFQSLDNLLEAHSYRLEAPTKLMVMSLTPLATIARDDIGTIKQLSLEDWLHHWYEFSEQNSSNFQTHLKMMGGIPAPHCFAVIKDKHGHIVSCGMAVKSGKGVGLSCIATAKAQRGKCYGKALLNKLTHWSAEQDASYCFLQVESENTSAISLYNKAGFTKLYSYWYRVKSLVGNSSVESSDSVKGAEK